MGNLLRENGIGAVALAVLTACGISGCAGANKSATVARRTSEFSELDADRTKPAAAPVVRPVAYQDSSEETEELNTPPPVESDATAIYTEPLEVQVSVDELIATALQTHPRIYSARQRVGAMMNRVPQARALPDPMLTDTFWPISDQALQTAGGRAANQVNLSQRVPWPAKLEARANVACWEIAIAEAEVAKAEREIVEAVQLAYYELWYTEAAIRIIEENKELVDDLITVSEARYKTGGSQQDVLRSELEADKLEDQLITLQRRKEQSQADLGALVRQPVHLKLRTSSEIAGLPIDTQIEQLVASAEQCNPTLRGLAAEISRDRGKETLACLEQYPDLQFGMGWTIIAESGDVISPVADGNDNLNFTVGITLPIWREKINAGIQEAAYNRSSTMSRADAERDRIRGQLRRQVAAAYAAEEQIKLFEERLIPRTEKTLEITFADYRGKKTDFLDVIETYRELLAFQVQLARSKATLAAALAQIERTVGCPVRP